LLKAGRQADFTISGWETKSCLTDVDVDPEDIVLMGGDRLWGHGDLLQTKNHAEWVAMPKEVRYSWRHADTNWPTLPTSSVILVIESPRTAMRGFSVSQHTIFHFLVKSQTQYIVTHKYLNTIFCISKNVFGSPVLCLDNIS